MTVMGTRLHAYIQVELEEAPKQVKLNRFQYKSGKFFSPKKLEEEKQALDTSFQLLYKPLSTQGNNGKRWQRGVTTMEDSRLLPRKDIKAW